ncbi:hypothetical protein ANCCAN_05141 [Ancylostoma caninum]|uniref:Uncharacterized protein n=1 Tax=Ancylostoma caninum TaxID=29170 RepID=A0A368H0W8_ANCCA|nr:hypothetical protein ANCCAN_05141 [Ancylostoma caninum]
MSHTIVDIFRESYKGGTGERFAMARPKDQFDRSSDPLEGTTINRESYKGGTGERFAMARPKDQFDKSSDPLEGTTINRYGGSNQQCWVRTDRPFIHLGVLQGRNWREICNGSSERSVRQK